MASNSPVHIGIDNQTVVSKLAKMKRQVESIEKSDDDIPLRELKSEQSAPVNDMSKKIDQKCRKIPRLRARVQDNPDKGEQQSSFA